MSADAVVTDLISLQVEQGAESTGWSGVGGHEGSLSLRSRQRNSNTLQIRARIAIDDIGVEGEHASSVIQKEERPWPHGLNARAEVMIRIGLQSAPLMRRDRRRHTGSSDVPLDLVLSLLLRERDGAYLRLASCDARVDVGLRALRLVARDAIILLGLDRVEDGGDVVATLARLL